MPRSPRSAALALAGALAVAGCAGTSPRPQDDGGAARLAPVFEHLQDGDYLRAEAALQALAEQTPDDARIHANFGIVYANTGRYAEAVAALETATRLAPRSAEAFNELGIARRKSGDFARAAEAYRAALRLNPDYSNAHYNLGVLLDLYLRQPSVALGHYERYLALTGDADPQVQTWVKDLRRRSGAQPATASNDGEVERR